MKEVATAGPAGIVARERAPSALARLLHEKCPELVRYEAHQAILDAVVTKISDVREVELSRDGVLEKLACVADLREIGARVLGESAQCAEVTARGREALLVAIDVEEVDHELDVRFEALAARDLLEMPEVSRQFGMVQMR